MVEKQNGIHVGRIKNKWILKLVTNYKLYTISQLMMTTNKTDITICDKSLNVLCAEHGDTSSEWLPLFAFMACVR
jgi:hypothetical protein